MPVLSRDEMPVKMEGDGVEVRSSEAGDMTASFTRVPHGMDMRPVLEGLPGNLCQCPHWGVMTKGRVKMHTSGGEEVYEAGQVFYWPPGHAPEVLEDAEWVEFSPTEELAEVMEHVQGETQAQG